eukprot:CAMPEP_0176425198 /NCGR_PEP_ID=MMETSP0127-20121128/11260_1 /TAXON_ID=938130 /ORGANISM="Platyophrya macrostoma, Strain WH" /LENGTH=768 /DNA_ID=CAMNT_0017806341 /DNA_START=12 /DNA_END=2318 /DNA_ORIENTATION=-
MDDKNFLSYFDKLSSDQDAKKLENARKIVDTLVSLEKTPEKLTKVQKSKFGESISEDLDYTINRLLTGATAKSLNAKLGFALPSVELLQKFESIDTQKITSVVFEVTDQKHAVSKGERSHFRIARILEFYSLILSGRVDQKSTDMKTYQLIYTDLLNSFIELPWTAQPCLLLIEESLLHGSLDSTKEKLKFLANHIKKQNLFSNLKDPNISTLYLILGHKMSLVKGLDPLQFVTRIDGFLNSSELKGLFQNLSNFYPEKHLWTKWAALYLVSHKNLKEQLDFWKLLSDYIQELMTNSKEQNYKIYLYILKFFKAYLKQEKLPIAIIQSLYQKSIFKLWIKNLSAMNKITKNVAIKVEKRFAEILPKVFEQKPTTLTPLKLLKMFKENTSLKFSTSNPLATTLYKAMDEKEHQEYIEFLITQFKQSDSVNSYLFYLNEVYVYFEISAFTLQEKHINTLAAFLIECSLRAPVSDDSKKNAEDSDDNENLPEEKKKEISKQKTDTAISKDASSKLQGFIQRLLKMPFSLIKNKKSNSIWLGLDANLEHWTSKVLKILIKSLSSQKEVPEYVNTMKRASKRIQEYQKQILDLWNVQTDNDVEQSKNRTMIKKIVGLILIISCSCLQLPQLPDLLESVEEILFVVEDVLKNYILAPKKEKKNKKVQKGKGESAKANGDEDEPNSIQVFVDLMISLLTRSSGYLREAVNRTFSTFVDNVDQFCVTNIISVIERVDEDYLADMESQGTQNPLGLDEEDEEGDESIENDDDEEEAE